MNKTSLFDIDSNLNYQDFLDYEKGWKFTEQDKAFLIKYYLDYAKVLKEYCDGDGLKFIQKIINSIKNYGVLASKDLIQEDVLNTLESVDWEIYEYYKEAKNVLWLIENSILDTERLKSLLVEL